MSNSSNLFKVAKSVLVGGVNSPVRAFKSVLGDPVYIKQASGPYLYSEDDNALIDYIGAFGPHILGHKNAAIEKALLDVIGNGLSFGAPTAIETTLGELVVGAIPHFEKVRFVNSGTEACMSALRLARGFTGRDLILKFNGCYHGHADHLLVAAGSGSLTFGRPDSAGVPKDMVKNTAVLEYNDVPSLIQFFKEHGDKLAAVILEPVCGNMGVIKPSNLFLKTLREKCDTHGSLLIFDEVMTGFRLSKFGAQGLGSITPDLTCLGKIIGGGLPCGAYGGRSEIMDYLSPIGPVYQAGTLSGNPLVMAAGIAMLTQLQNDEVYTHLECYGSALEKGIYEIFSRHSQPVQINRVGSMICPFFTETPVIDLATAKTSDTKRFAKFHRFLLDNGVFLPPSQFESWFFSTSHSELELDMTLSVIDRFFS